MKEQCFLVRKDRRGRGVTVLSRDKTEVSRGGWSRWFFTMLTTPQILSLQHLLASTTGLSSTEVYSH